MIDYQLHEYAPRQEVARERQRRLDCCVIVDGIAARYNDAEAGKRQILSLDLPGDIPDLERLHFGFLGFNIVAITKVTVGFASHTAIRAFLQAQPRIAEVLWRDTMVEAAVLREWMTRLGVRSAYQRVAHLFCELTLRQKARSLLDDDASEMPLPLSQIQMGEILGLTSVHVNRTIGTMRSAGLIEYRRGRLIILDWPRLQEAGDFDAAYLHLRKDGASA